MEESKENSRSHKGDYFRPLCILIHPATKLLYLFILANFITACASMHTGLEPPKVNLSNIQPLEIKGLESTFQIELRVFNTNDTPITIKGIDCELQINDNRFALGISDDEVKIPSFESEIIPIKIYSSFFNVFKGVLGLKNKESVQYKIKGKISIRSDYFLPIKAPFVSEGELSLDNFLD